MGRSWLELFDESEPVADQRQRFADAVGRIDDSHHDKHDNSDENAQVQERHQEPSENRNKHQDDAEDCISAILRGEAAQRQHQTLIAVVHGKILDCRAASSGTRNSNGGR